ncbi:MAG: hypothetical protein IJ784_13715, partial [Ruminiclostridium sp.]|nr:hypothetical protein [Ruminiclostridium sp.]
MRYSLKNLCSMFTKQRLLSLLLVLNIVVSCFVICFSYGLYQSYNVVIEEGENPVYKELTIKASDGKKHRSDEYEIDLSEVTIGEFTAMLTSLSDDLTDNISSIDLFLGVDQDLYCECTDQEALSDTGVYANYIHLDVKHHMIISGGTDVGCISDEDYSSGKKLVALGTEMFGSHGGTIGYSSKSYTAVPLTDEKNITIEGEPYEILRINRHLDGRMIFPITSLSDDKLLWAEPISNDVFTIRFNEPIKVSQYSELHDTIDQYFRGKVTTPSLKFKNADELYYYRTVLIISVLIALLVSVNMTVLYRYILERRSRELAIFRICGCTGRSAVMMYLAECLTVSLPLFALTELFWHKLLMKRIARLFEHFEGAYSPKLYAAVFGIYAVSVTVVMYIMIRATVKKHSLAELKTEAHSAGFLIFKVLETVQLSAVLVLIISIWSAGMSRYDLYTPFADLLRGKGYVVNY